MTEQEGKEFARTHSMLFMECSAKTEVGVQQAFHELIHKVLTTLLHTTPQALFLITGFFFLF